MLLMAMDNTDFIHRILENEWGLSPELVNPIRMILLIIAAALICGIIHALVRNILIGTIGKLVRRSRTQFDDIFFEKKTFSWIAHFAPALVFHYGSYFILLDYPDWVPVVQMLVRVYMVVIVLGMIGSILNSLREIASHIPAFSDKPVGSYVQLAKIIMYLIGGVLIISMMLGRNPLVILGTMGAASAVLLLVFKDTILGFVASIHISANDLVHVGDWITVEKYGADGDVTEINLATVKVRNFDNTITSVPTYAFVSDSFRNWRGMLESQGRRIKRSVIIDKTSIHFLQPHEIESLQKIDLLKNYLAGKIREIEAYNREKEGSESDVNRRKLTNIGTFRVYLEKYLEQHPGTNSDMTSMVRQLQATEHGLPIEIYAFSKDKKWVNYEHLMADIFDHVFAIVPQFGLQVFQSPTGRDVQEAVAALKQSSQELTK